MATKDKNGSYLRIGSIYEYNYKGRFFRLSREEILKLNFIPVFDEKNITD